MKRYKSVSVRTAECVRHESDVMVQDGLAYTPSKMLELANKGIPISTQTAAATFDDGKRTIAFEPDVELLRGIDVGTLWEKHMEVRAKVMKASQKQE